MDAGRSPSMLQKAGATLVRLFCQSPWTYFLNQTPLRRAVLIEHTLENPAGLIDLCALDVERRKPAHRVRAAGNREQAGVVQALDQPETRDFSLGHFRQRRKISGKLEGKHKADA